MDIQNVSNLPSDPDITVILVKKSLHQCQGSKSGDGKNFSTNTSLVNFAAHKQEGKDDTSSTLSPVSSWDFDTSNAAGRSDLAMRSRRSSSLSIKNEDLFRIRDSPRSSNSDVALKTIQNSYDESDPENHTERNNCSTFVDVELPEPYVENVPVTNRASVRDLPETRRKSKTPFSACFSCMSKGNDNEDE